MKPKDGRTEIGLDLGDQVMLLVLQALHDRRIWRYYPLVLDDGWRIHIAVAWSHNLLYPDLYATAPRPSSRRGAVSYLKSR